MSTEVKKEIQLSNQRRYRRKPRLLLYSYGVNAKNYTGRSSDLPRNLEEHWKKGAKIPVVYDPRNPSRSELIFITFVQLD